jgi:hypothetical protein
MSVANPTFSLPGALPGQAANWTLFVSTALEVIAGFGKSPDESAESFERWFTLIDEFDSAPQVRAFFTGASIGYESFNSGWSNSAFLTEFGDAQLSSAPFGISSVEAFEPGWSNTRFARIWQDVTSTLAQFNDRPFEDFEQRWRNNELFVRDWSRVIATQSLFDSGVNSKEGFDSIWSTIASL